MQEANDHMIPEEKRLALRRLSGWVCCIIGLLWMADIGYGHDIVGQQEAELPAGPTQQNGCR